MGRDKKKDDKNFNCFQDHEMDYVCDIYPGHEDNVREFLEEKCDNNEIKYSTHMEVYEIIRKELGYPIPVEE